VRHPNSQTAADYSLSANGTLVYVPGDESSASVGFSVLWVDRTGRVVERAIEEPVEFARDPRLSPDGTRLAVTTGPLNQGSLWVYDLRGRPPIPLAVGDDNRAAVWSPDGKQIAFLKSTLTGGVYITQADGSVANPQPLVNGVLGMPYVWSNANELFLITPQQNNRGPDISVVRAADPHDVRDIVATDYTEFDPALSPNGNWLAYVSDRTGESEIWVKGYPDGVAVRVSRNGGTEPRWSTNGTELFYLQANAMMSVAVQTGDDFSFGTPVELFVTAPFFTVPTPATRTYDVARDGRFLMIQTTTGAGEPTKLGSFVVVQNWIEELKQRVPARR
jgi:serine/threonine-protein kinase